MDEFAERPGIGFTATFKAQYLESNEQCLFVSASLKQKKTINIITLFAEFDFLSIIHRARYNADLQVR